MQEIFLDFNSDTYFQSSANSLTAAYYSFQHSVKGPKCRCFTFIKGQLRQLFIFRIEPTCIIDTLQKAVGNFDCSQGFGKEPIPKRIFQQI